MRNFSKSSSLTMRCPPEKGKWVYVFANGSRKNKRVLISPYSTRCFDSLLNHLTDKLNPTFGAVRNIYTIEGEPIKDLGSLENEKTYVVTGVEKYRPGNVGVRRSIVGHGHVLPGRASDGGDFGSLKEKPMRRPHRRSSKEVNSESLPWKSSEEDQVYPTLSHQQVVYQTSSFDSAQHEKLEQIMNHSNQRHVMTTNYQPGEPVATEQMATRLLRRRR